MKGLKSRAFSKKSQFWSIFEISLEFIPSLSGVVVIVGRHYLVLLGSKLIIIITCYDFIVTVPKSGFRYISRKRDETGSATNGLTTFVYEFFSVWEGFMPFACLTRKL